MTSSDRIALRALAGAKASTRATTDDLQNLLLQVVFALLMIFMIAYFTFVEQQKKVRAEEVMALNRQKLTLALEKVAEDRRVRYGLNALMVQGVDGRRVFDPDTLVADGALRLAPAAKSAFSQGGRAALADYADLTATTLAWKADVLAEAELSDADLSPEEAEWFLAALGEEVEKVRLDVRGVQRSLAARLQRQWGGRPELFEDIRDPRAIADSFKRRSLKLVADEIGSEVLP